MGRAKPEDSTANMTNGALARALRERYGARTTYPSMNNIILEAADRLEQLHQRFTALSNESGPTISVIVNKEVVSETRVAEINFQNNDKGVIIVAHRPHEGKELQLSDFLQALQHAQLLKPSDPVYQHLPLGVYDALIRNGAIPLKNGELGGPGIEGYWVSSSDPEAAVKGIEEALRGDAWPADEDFICGALDEGEDGEVIVRVLFRRLA